MKFSWGSAALGALVGSGLTFGILRIPSTPDSGSSAPTNPVARTASTEKTHLPSTPAGLPPVEQATPVAKEGIPALAAELSARLEAAYRQEALPEIIGAEAGAEAADQVYDYIVAADDTDVVSDLLGDFLERSSEELEIPGFGVRAAMDCETSPCVARLELVPPTSEAECRAAMFTIKYALKESLQPGSGQFDVEGCRMTVVALSPDARAREQEIDQGVEGFLKQYFAPAKERASALELP